MPGGFEPRLFACYCKKVMIAALMRQIRKPEFFLGLILAGLILFLYGLFLVHRIDLTTADLGRHLQNGRMILENRALWSANFYSYTAPDYPVMNHHWLGGLVFFLIWRLAGFNGLHLGFIALSLAALFIFMRIAARQAGPGPAALAAVAALPLLAERTEIRPEVFTYLFAGIFFWILLRYQRLGNWRILLALPILEALWVNMHIYFFLGPALIGVFLVGALLDRSGRDRTLRLAWTLAAAAATTLLNPSGLKGAAAPFTIFQNYGYRIAENQPVWFIETLLRNPNFIIFKILFGLLAVSFLARLLMRRRLRADVQTQTLNIAAIPYLLLGIMASAMAWLATRNFALFGLFLIPLLSLNIAAIFGSWLTVHRRAIAAGAAIFITVLTIPGLFGQWQKYFPYWKEAGLGLEADNGRAAEFFRGENLKGPIFNNYDIGGYLIWHLFPQERVFTDNRPEAYPAGFFNDIYVPMQETDEVWRREMERWRFNAVFFSHRDMTQWGQQFLIARIKDSQWAPVFADRYAIIFLKRNEENRPIIERLEIPQSAFRIVKR